jgi:ThiF family
MLSTQAICTGKLTPIVDNWPCERDEDYSPAPRDRSLNHSTANIALHLWYSQYRQVLYREHQRGVNKAVAAAEALRALNHLVTVTPYAEALTYDNALQLAQLYDLVVDAR